MYPMRINPVYKDYLWGGTKLNKSLNKNSKFLRTAESWELSCCKDGLSVINNGFFKDKILFELLKEFPHFVGDDWDSKSEFPLLIKLIDAKDKLSIQVHPSDKLADKSKGQQGKAEMWYIIDCQKNSFIYMGLKENKSEVLIEESVLSGNICDYLNKVFVKPGDVFYIKPGTIHAIGAGILIAEIQQNSNTTFRLFDYNRVDSNGNRRELHLKEALRVCDKEAFVLQNNEIKNLAKMEETAIRLLVNSEFFRVLEYDIKSVVSMTATKKSFQALLFIDGTASIFFKTQKYEVKKGDCYFIPAGMGEYKIDGVCKFLISGV